MIVKDVTIEQYSFHCAKCGANWTVGYRVEHVEDGHGHEHDYYLCNGLPSLNPQTVPPICLTCQVADVTVELVSRQPEATATAARAASRAPAPEAGETWMRVVTYRPRNPDDGAAIDYMRASAQGVLRMLGGIPGFQRGFWGEDASTGTISAVSYWDSLTAIEAAAELLNQLQAERARYGVIVRSTSNIRLLDTSAVRA